MTNGTAAEPVDSFALDDRIRLMYLVAGMAIVAALAVASVTWDHVQVEVMEAGGQKKTKPLSFGDLRWFWIPVLATMVPAAAFLIWEFWSRIVGHSARLTLRFAPDDGTRRERQAYSVDHLNKAMPAIRFRNRFALRASAFAMLGAMIWLCIKTGGLVVSPFVQFGATLFLLGMLLTDALTGRVLLGLGALLVVIVVYVADGNTGTVAVSEGWYFSLTLLGLLLNVIAALVAARTIRSSYRNELAGGDGGGA